MQELSILQIQMEAGKQQLRDSSRLCLPYGLVLSEDDMTEFIQCRQNVLRETGRVEFGGGILPKLIRKFSDSPYVDRENFVSVLAELQEAFYYFKNECDDRFSDDDLIDFMHTVFNGKAAGASELLCSISLEELCRWARNVGDSRYDDEEDLWG